MTGNEVLRVTVYTHDLMMRRHDSGIANNDPRVLLRYCIAYFHIPMACTVCVYILLCTCMLIMLCWKQFSGFAFP